MGRGRRSLGSLCLRVMHARTARARVGRFVLIAAQIVALALSIQLTGAPHILADAAFGDDCGDCSQDDRERNDDTCPPGCPTCHTCAHAQVPYVPRAEIVHAACAPLVLRRERPSRESPPLLPPGSVFRPPRA